MVDRRGKILSDFIAPLRVPPGKRVTLAKDFDPGWTSDLVEHEGGKELLQRGVDLMADYQERLAAQDTYGLLVVLQALDAAGKDGTIKHVMSGVNPQGVRVSSFKVPSAEELDHDYLWRYQQRLPGRGEIAIFNRSYYEEVLVVRVHPENLVRQRLPREARGRDVWKRRYEEINQWERMLDRNGFRIVKIFLNLSKEEQRERFLARIDESDKNWKFSAADARERQFWDDYQKAFSDMLSNTSTEHAPWYVVPADHKWFARICASAIIADALVRIDPKFPEVSMEAREELASVRVQLVAEAPPGAVADPKAAAEAEAAAEAAEAAAAAARRELAEATAVEAETAVKAKRALGSERSAAARAAGDPAPGTAVATRQGKPSKPAKSQKAAKADKRGKADRKVRRLAKAKKSRKAGA